MPSPRPHHGEARSTRLPVIPRDHPAEAADGDADGLAAVAFT
ncbi:hypothetical protein SFR_2813 [Streptomyces sp. FR-008]|nr:hypothetical protein SFR_2813 [Streptomyces sp. FR-008]